MEIKQVKRFLCAVCKTKEIYHKRTAHLSDREIPDVSTVELVRYSDHKVEGGLLLKSRALSEPWEREDAHFPRPVTAPHYKLGLPLGGICEDCLRGDPNKNPVVLLSRIGGLVFEDNILRF